MGRNRRQKYQENSKTDFLHIYTQALSAVWFHMSESGAYRWRGYIPPSRRGYNLHQKVDRAATPPKMRSALKAGAGEQAVMRSRAQRKVNSSCRYTRNSSHGS